MYAYDPGTWDSFLKKNKNKTLNELRSQYLTELYYSLDEQIYTSQMMQGGGNSYRRFEEMKQETPDTSDFLIYLSSQTGSVLTDEKGIMNANINQNGTIDFHPVSSSVVLYNNELLGIAGDLDSNYLTYYSSGITGTSTVTVQNDAIVGDYLRFTKGSGNCYIVSNSQTITILPNSEYTIEITVKAALGTTFEVWLGVSRQIFTSDSITWKTYTINGVSSAINPSIYIYTEMAGAVFDVSDVRIKKAYTISEYLNLYQIPHNFNTSSGLVYYPLVKYFDKWGIKKIIPTSESLSRLVVSTNLQSYAVRTPYNTSNDLSFVFYNNINTTNDEIDISGVYIIPATSANTYSSLTGGIGIAGQSDDSCPTNYNGTYIGAGHGNAGGRTITMVSHGKTNIDIGSEWVDTIGKLFYIIKIVDSNNLIILSKNYGTNKIWQFISPTGNLTHSSGATHTNTIILGTPVLYQIPAISNHTKEFLLDGKYLLSGSITSFYGGNHFVAKEKYDIVNQDDMLNSLIARVGTSSEPDFSVGEPQTRHDITYTYYNDSTMIIDYKFDILQDINLNYFGFIQAAPMNNSVSYPNTKLYIPKTLPIVAGARTFDLRTLEDYNSAKANTVAINLTPPYWEIPSKPPSRQIEFLANASGSIGPAFAMGYHPDSQLYINRSSYINNAWYLYTSRKSYPFGIDGKLNSPTYLLGGNSFSGVMFRKFYDSNYVGKGNATSVMWYIRNGYYYVYIDYHVIISNDIITLPVEMNNKSIYIIEQSTSIVLNTNSVIDSQISVSCVSTNGHLTIRI